MSDPLLTGKKIQKMRPVGKLAHIPANDKEIQVAKYHGICHIEGPGFERKLALTFDDGPSPLTEMLLDLLKELDVKATFFWLGQRLKEFSALVRRAFEEGHTLGIHSFDHIHFTQIDIDEVLREQIRKTQLIYRETLGIEPTLVRPPFGIITDELIETLKDLEMKVVFWSIDAGDWIARNNTVDDITDRVLNNIHEEAIVLMHDGISDRIDTIKAVRSIVTGCKAQRYEFVTVHELIGSENSFHKMYKANNEPYRHTPYFFMT
jgi:peptidoglycan/xylan/chitin deacetylase (PgdA/CDA1 family)